MQITLVQTEIETAIRNYIHSQIVVKEGMKIDIILKATRGDEGTTAIIDITPEGQVPASAASAPVAAPVQKKVVPVVAAVPTQTKAAEPELEPEPVPEKAESAEADPCPELADGVELVEAEPASDPTPRKSLFGNLSKPKNS